MQDRSIRRGREGQYLEYRYKKSLAWYRETLAAQGGGCAICGRKPNHRRLHVDHDHSCCPGKNAPPETHVRPNKMSCGECVRGLLCDYCNTRLRALENDEWRTAAESYIAKHSQS